LKIVKSPDLNKNHPIYMKFGTQQQIGESHVIKCEFFLKIKDGGQPPYFKS